MIYTVVYTDGLGRVNRADFRAIDYSWTGSATAKRKAEDFAAGLRVVGLECRIEETISQENLGVR